MKGEYMLITFFRKLIILASFLFVLGVAQTQVSADGSSSSSSTLVNQDTLNAIDDASKQADKAVDEVTNDAEKSRAILAPLIPHLKPVTHKTSTSLMTHYFHGNRIQKKLV